MKPAEVARRHFNGSLKNTLTVTAGLGGTGAQPLAVTMNEGVNISIEICKNRIQKRLDTKYLDCWTDNYSEAIDKAIAHKQKVRLYQ